MYTMSKDDSKDRGRRRQGEWSQKGEMKGLKFLQTFTKKTSEGLGAF